MRILGWIIIIVLLFIIYLMIAPRGQYSEPESSSALIRKSEAQSLILNEPKILDATINEAGILYAAVIDDGTVRDGFASYLCELYSNNRALVKRVKIIQYGSSKSPKKDNAYGILLGEANCTN